MTEPQTYIAQLTQANEGDPEPNVLTSTFGGAIVWTRRSAGIHVGKLPGAFPDESKIFGLREWHMIPAQDGGRGYWRLQWNDEDETPGDSLLLDTVNEEGEPVDGLLAATPISFTVYP